MKPYFENILMPCSQFPIKSFITTTMEHVIEVHPHWHQETEILYYMRGSALQQVNDDFFTAGPGDIVIIAKDQLHSTYTIGKSDCEILVLQFDAGCLPGEGMQGRPPAAGADFNTGTIYRNPICTASAEGGCLLQCIMEIHDELAEKDSAYEYIVRAALYRFTGILTRSGLFTVADSSGESLQSIHAMLEKTFKLVDDSFTDEISLAEAALASNLSVTHFCRLFKKSTGMTFHEYLTFYRINRAERMLDPSKKLTDTAFDCGFGSVTSFVRNFKKHKNCTPSQYLRR